MRLFLIVTLFGLALTASCSRQPSERLSVELVVDGKAVIKESATDKKADELYRRHAEFMDVMGKACEYAKFLTVRITSSSQMTKMKIGPISNLNNQILLCHSGVVSASVAPSKVEMTGCSLEPAWKARQPQYTLQLLDWLESRHGMKSQAQWLYKFHEESPKKGSTSEQKIQVQITRDGFACEDHITAR